MKFLNGGTYKGQFINDQADGDCQYEDASKNLFQNETGVEKDSKDTGALMNGRLQNLCSVSFTNGDYFKGIFKDGMPNGKGKMYYKTSVKSMITGIEYETAQYEGNFRNGKRDGYGKMVWADGSSFVGTWKNDERHHGTMIMTQSGCVYKGKFKNDIIHDKNGILMLPSFVIYQGEFFQGKTRPLSLLMFQNGDIYYGQHNQFIKNGVGKLIEFNGGFQEGQWDTDKLNGNFCRVYDAVTGDIFSGPISDNKKNGVGRQYDFERDEVYEGTFEMNKKNGEGVIYLRNGQVMKGDFRNNQMEGAFENVMQISK